MDPVRRLTNYVQDVVATIHDVFAFDDPLLCECVDDRWCVDCSLLTADGPRPAPADPAA